MKYKKEKEHGQVAIETKRIPHMTLKKRRKRTEMCPLDLQTQRSRGKEHETGIS